MNSDLSMADRVDISVCICTYKRPELLDALLAGLQGQREGGLRLQVVVADNDPDASARQVLDQWLPRIRFPMRTLHVPAPNIALARNACVGAAAGEWIAFIDDDEQPDADWIAMLAVAAREFDADIVFGPVIPVLPKSTPDWMIDGGFFERRRHATGTPATLDDARTGNALVRASALTGVPGPFDPAFGSSGGSDSVLFRQLHANGARMVWSDDAVVHEAVPPERATAGWLLQRSFRNGQVALRSRLLATEPGMRFGTSAAHAFRSLFLMLGWLAISAIAIPRSRASAMRALRKAAGQSGILLAAFGHRYREYGP